MDTPILEDIDKRKGKPTGAHKSESAALLAIWNDKKRSLKMSQEDFADTFNIGSQAAMNHFLHGRSIISLKAAGGFAKGLRVDIAEFSARLASEATNVSAGLPNASDDFAYVPRARVEVSAGHGALVYDEGNESALSFRRDYLRDQGVSDKNAVIVTVKGSSMEPIIANGAVLLINHAARQRIVNGQIYAFRLDGELYVKQLFADAQGIIAKSENPDKDEYPDMIINEKSPDFQLIGRAIWMGRKL